MLRAAIVMSALAAAAAAAQESPPQDSSTGQNPATQAPRPGDAGTAGDSTQDPPPSDSAAPQAPPPEAAPLVATPPKKKKGKAREDTRDANGNAVRLEDIEVTASKRAKSERDIPGSVGAIRGGQLEEMRAQGLKDYLKLVPGVMYADTGNEESLPIIRGISTSLSFGATPTTTGVYLDDMPFADLFSASSIPDLNPFDLERVEVLKGPQGTLFGSGSFAGALRYIVHKPDHSVWEAKVSETLQQTYGSNGLSPTMAGAVNIPIFGDAVAIRAVGLSRKDAGLYDMSAHDSSGNVIRNDPDADRFRQNSARVLASWNTPLDGLKVAGFYFGQTTHQADFGVADQPYDLSSDNFPYPSPRDHDFGGGNLTVSYDFPAVRVFSSTNRMTKHNYFDQHEEFGLGSFENQRQNEFMAILRDDVKGWTQEVRLMSPEGGDFGNVEWLVGASILHYGDSAFQFTWIGQAIDDPKSREDISQQEIAEAQVYATTDEVAGEKALFGEITGRLTEAWEVTLGLRKYQTSLLADTVLCGAQTLALFQTLCYPQHFDQKTNGLNPKVSVRYVHNRNVQWYWLAAKGFQFGGVQINPPAPGFPESAQDAGFSFGPYKSSQLWNYESGVRTEWLDRRLRLDMTLFYMDWKDLQMTIAVPFEHTTAQFNIIANVGRAHSEGLETALEVLPFTGAKWTSAACWITAVTDQPVESPSGGTIPPGTRLPGTPKFQWSNVVSYEHSMPLFPTWNVGPVLTHAFNTKGSDALEPTGTVGGYHTLDARIALTKPDSRFLPEFTIGMNNITDVRGATFHVHGGNVSPGGADYDFTHFNTPRTVLASFAMKY